MRSSPPLASTSPPASMSNSLNLNEVLPRFATRTSIFVGWAFPTMQSCIPTVGGAHPAELECRAAATCAKARQQIFVRPRDHVRRHQFTNATSALRACIHSRFHAADIAAHDRGDERPT